MTYLRSLPSRAVLRDVFAAFPQTSRPLLDDVDAAPVDERMKPVLRYVRKLTRTPSRLTAADAEAVLAARWDEQALHDAASVCGLFNLMNRLVEGLGIHADAGYFRLSAERLATQGYAGLLASPTAPDVGSGGGVPPAPARPGAPRPGAGRRRVAAAPR
jgi:hypothetical protein